MDAGLLAWNMKVKTAENDEYMLLPTLYMTHDFTSRVRITLALINFTDYYQQKYICRALVASQPPHHPSDHAALLQPSCTILPKVRRKMRMLEKRATTHSLLQCLFFSMRPPWRESHASACAQLRSRKGVTSQRPVVTEEEGR